MKRTLFTLLCALLSMTMAYSQSYQKLWKQATEAWDNDLPRTALDVVSQIQTKAEREHNASQLIRALCTRVTLGEDIASDSLGIEIDRMRQYRDAETRPVERALWNCALSKVYTSHAWRDTSYSRLAEQCREAMLQNFDALSKARTKNYLPLFNQGNNSSYFKHDVLHVLAYDYLNNHVYLNNSSSSQRQLLSRLVRHYRSLGNQEAALLWQLDSVNRVRYQNYNVTDNPSYAALQRIAQENRSLQLNVLTYIAMTELGYSSEINDSILSAVAEEGLRLYGKTPQANALRNYLSQTNLPAMSLSGLPDMMYPGQGREVHLSLKALGSCEVRVYRINDVAARTYAENQRPTLSLPRTLVRTDEYRVPTKPAYIQQDTTIRFIAPEEPGIYLVRLYDGKEEKGEQVFYCTRLKYVHLGMEGDRHRVTIVDALSGTPIVGAKLDLCNAPERQQRVTDMKVADEDGNFFINFLREEVRTAYASFGDDAYLPGFKLYKTYRSYYQSQAETRISLYTDRGIYRPGQQVFIGGFVYTQIEDSIHTEQAYTVEASLYDSHHKLLNEVSIVTDEYGAFGGDFTLPDDVLPGQFSIVVRGTDQRAAVNFDVQEYKRPTFFVELDPITQPYQPGDTLMVSGRARTYSDLPVEGAKVSYETNRYELIYWYRRGNENKQTIQQGSTVTDSEGRFSIPMVLNADRDSYYRTYFQTRVDVTAPQGETQSAQQDTYVSYRSAYLSVNWPQTICFEHTPVVTPRLVNAQGNDIAATGLLTIHYGNHIVHQDSIALGQPLAVQRNWVPAPGKYTVKISVTYHNETYADSQQVRFFSETDTRPAAGDDFWYNVRSNEQGDSAYVIIGSARNDVSLFYDVVGKERIIESRRILLSDSLLHFQFAWKPEYDDAVTVTFAFVKDYTLYEKSVTIVKPEPDKRLTMQWTSFRSRLTPGQQEEWRLRVTLPDGTPVRASMLARLYDASINALRDYQWRFNLNFPRYVPSANWSHTSRSFERVSGYYSYDPLDAHPLNFTTWADGLINSRLQSPHLMSSGIRYSRATSVDAVMVYDAMPMANAMVEEVAFEATADEAGISADDDLSTESQAVVPRTNFNETAFFYPRLVSDEQGQVALSFTLPESITQWNFQALAHTTDLRFALSDTMCVARKEFMVEPAMPRFVRMGDVAQIPVSIRNLTEQTLHGTLLMEILDPANLSVIHKETLPFDVTANSSKVKAFPVNTENLTDHGVVVVRITGKSGNYGDGEEHYLPILSSREQVLTTLPFTLTNHTAQTLRIDTLWNSSSAVADRTLTIEATSNPTWYAVTALPVIADRTCYSSTDWAERLYAVVLAKYIAEQNPSIQKAFADTTLSAWANVLARNPELKNTVIEETPWLVNSENEADRAAALSSLFDANQNALKEHSALDGLRKLQLADGSWTWCQGMAGDLYMTTRIAVILARLQHLTNYQTDMLQKAFGYIETQLVEYVKEAKKEKYKGCPYVYLRYLYAASLTGRTSSLKAVRDAIAYLVEQVEDNVANEDMHTKSMCAVVLAHYGKSQAAQVALQSLLEHTSVGEPGRGRFFDTNRAPMTWSSYRIPTQTSTIEALTMTAPDVMWSANGALVGVRDQVLSEMKLWLLQAKRTQMWETSSASVDAIYALLIESDGSPSSDLLRQTNAVRYTLQNRSGRIVTANRREDVQGQQTAGYICDHYVQAPGVDAYSITLRGYDNSVSWGSVYARYTLPIEDVVAEGKGFTLTRRMEIRKEGEWISFDESQTSLHVGDRIRVVFTITADRDYDYVSLRAGRPACTEPADQLSGYRWSNVGAMYRVVRDTDLQYFFSKVAKGTHTFTEELYIDREGTYSFAPSRIQSLYSPEFQAICKSSVFSVLPQ